MGPVGFVGFKFEVGGIRVLGLNLGARSRGGQLKGINPDAYL